MKFAIGALAVAVGLGMVSANAAGAGCEIARLSVEPAAKAGDVAATLRRRLVAAGEQKPSVEVDGAGLSAVIPAGLPASTLTRLAKIEFRFVAKSPNDSGAIAMARVDGGAPESVDPQIIVNEGQLRDFKVKPEPGSPQVFAIHFHFEPTSAKNLMAASMEGIGRKLAIIVDDKILADPLIRAPIGSIVGEISGGFTRNSADELVKLLETGRLDAHVVILDRKPAPCR